MKAARFVCTRCNAVTDVFFHQHETPPTECQCAYCHGVAENRTTRRAPSTDKGQGLASVSAQ